jgi:2-phosphoglycerate kinase
MVKATSSRQSAAVGQDQISVPPVVILVCVPSGVGHEVLAEAAASMWGSSRALLGSPMRQFMKSSKTTLYPQLHGGPSLV